MLETDLQKILKDILRKLNIPDVEPVVERIADLSHGDYSTNIALVAAKRLGKNPWELAQDIVSKWSVASSQLSVVEKVEVAGAGFINFWLLKEELSNKLNLLLIDSEKVVKSNKLTGKKMMVEFAHPNTHKALHIGHLRNITTGESIVRLLESQGTEVIRTNYQGDVGMHIAKAMYGLLDLSPFRERLKEVEGIQERVDFLGKAYAAGSQEYENSPAAKEKIHDYNYLIYASAQRFQEEKGIASGNTDYLQFVKGRKEEIERVYAIWKETRTWSLDYYEMMYQKLDTHFDRYYFEGECLYGVDLAKEAVVKGVLKISEGAIIFNGKPFGLDTRVFVNRMGLPTYEAKELSLSKKELSEFGRLDQIIHVVGPEQASFFQVTFKAEELLGYQKDQQRHLVYGWVRLKHGKMSSRLGNVITGDQLIRAVVEQIKNIQQKTDSKLSDEEKDKLAELVAVAAIKYSFLKVSVNQDIAFDLEESISAEGNSGPYLQYTYARTRSVIRKAGVGGSTWHVEDQLRATTHELQPEEENLLRLLYFFDETVVEAAEKYSPNILANYLYILAQQFNLFYQKHSILNPLPVILTPTQSGEESESDSKDSSADLNRVQNDKVMEDTRNFRLALTAATGNVIKKGLYLLGIQAPEQM